MLYYCAPLEGMTGSIFRNAHQRYFPGVDKYYMPFLSPSHHHVFTKRERREIDPQTNKGARVVPQLLTKRSEDFLWAANELFHMGYGEVNLNLGCPSGTVVTKGKGSGFLADLEGLDYFLEEIFAKAAGPISIKTRLGLTREDEFWPLLEMYNKYPLVELTIHPRLQKDFYRGTVRLSGLEQMLETSRNPVCYNGDLTTRADFAHLIQAYPSIKRVMVGRGLMANPALITREKGGPETRREAIEAFHDELYHGYAQAFGSERSAMMRMKELWFYLGGLFGESGRYLKKIKKTTDPLEYEGLAQRIFQELELLPEAVTGR